MSRFVLRTLALCVLLNAAAVTTANAQAHDHGNHASSACDVCPLPREASGTAWQPDLADAAHPYRSLGSSWWLGAHAQVALTATDEHGPRGDSGLFAPNHGMVSLRRRAGAGTFAVRTMWSVEPLMGARGYPLLLQSGETADGVNPLADRQHPHDMVMELAVAYQRPLASGATLSLYMAAVGEPALGPPAYMHRRSGELLPIAPITHHWFDSTHTTAGVITAGFAPSPDLRFEVSAFRGREPDQHRWNFEAPKLDSFSARLSINPTPALAIQASAGFLKNAERIHPGANVTRMTASILYARRGPRVSIDAMGAFGRNARTATLFEVPGGYYYSPSATSPALIGEATIGFFGRHQLIVRVERADKGELFPMADPRHLDQFAVSRTTLGYALPVMRSTHATLHVGTAWSHSRMAEALREDYGGNQAGYLGFVRLAVH